ncbi:hypothetical protein NE237_016986 [Protea cynaroides]|uniref:Uncharacterized protein n=1 Tax=Protea cynaroides TaxID=273540 RepID=A0A9Q0K762_9MAGN|nr:hypothetical protein NE237_016986 [Protea cynaroides]
MELVHSLGDPLLSRSSVCSSFRPVSEISAHCSRTRQLTYGSGAEPQHRGLGQHLYNSQSSIGSGQDGDELRLVQTSSVAQVVTTFQERGAMEYTIVVAETVDSPATLQYLAPYTGAALVCPSVPPGSKVANDAGCVIGTCRPWPGRPARRALIRTGQQKFQETGVLSVLAAEPRIRFLIRTEWNKIRISGAAAASLLTRNRLSLCRRLLPNGIIVRKCASIFKED